jgi:hypothetical protein
MTLDLVEYRLRSRRPPVGKQALETRAQAISWLTRVADGRIDLPSATPVATSTNRGVLGETTGEPRLLTRDELSGH